MIAIRASRRTITGAGEGGVVHEGVVGGMTGGPTTSRTPGTNSRGRGATSTRGATRTKSDSKGTRKWL